MKAIPLMSIWIASFLMSVATVESLSFLFWVSFIVFGLASTYIARHEKRIFREIEDIEKKLKGR